MIRRCSACHRPNRVPPRHLADSGRCGSCKAPLPPISEPIDTDEATFDEVVREASVPVLVDFWAAWCAPCRRAAPEVARVAQQMAGKAIVLKVDTERSPAVAARYRVQSIPNFVVLKDGQVVLQRAGLVDAAQLGSWLAAA